VKLTKYTHSCVRIEKDGKVLVVDPGIWAEEEALAGADAILITHEHFDHVDQERIPSIEVPIWTTAGVAAKLTEDGIGDRVTVVEDGKSFEAAGFAVKAFGRDHAIILPEMGVPCDNVGFLIEDAIYHPGDSWTKPDREVHTNLVPLAAPWFTMPGAVEYVRTVDAEQLVGIHDAMLSEIGLGMARTWITAQSHKPYHGLTPGDWIELD
jgi:L-ascorbate metabolism protein UlaG (beta-lactamase superfamily)